MSHDVCAHASCFTLSRKFAEMGRQLTRINGEGDDILVRVSFRSFTSNDGAQLRQESANADTIPSMVSETGKRTNLLCQYKTWGDSLRRAGPSFRESKSTVVMCAPAEEVATMREWWSGDDFAPAVSAGTRSWVSRK